MYGRIIIKTATGLANIKTTAHDSIYDFLTEHGYSHEEAADVASWAPDAPIGEEYDLHGAKITIVE